MYLLDTNICIYALKDKYPLLSKKLLQVHPEEMAVSSVTVGELEYGAAKSRWGDQTRTNLYLFLSAFTILPFTSEDGIAFGRIRAELEQKGTPIGPYDLMIAAQALRRGFTIVTHNTDEFMRVEHLNVDDWTL